MATDLQPTGDDPPRARGKAIVREDGELDRLAEITDADLDRARVLWRRSVEGELRDLIDADPDPEAE